MEFIEKLISELNNNETIKTESSNYKETGMNPIGSDNGEKREIIIHYTVGDEKNAKIVSGTEEIGYAEDSIALMYVIGNTVGDLLDCEGEIVTTKIIEVVSNTMSDYAMNMILDMIKKLTGD